MKLRKIVLKGFLAEKYGEEWNLAVNSPAEAFRAIEVNRPGFLKDVADAGNDGYVYQVCLDQRDLDETELRFPFGNETLYLVPCIQGAGKGGGIIKTILGIIIMVVAIVTFNYEGIPAGASFFGSAYGAAFMFGMSMTLGGISQLLTSTPTSELGNSDKKESYTFNGPINTTNQGNPVPIGYGRLTIGSQVISGGIYAEDIPI
jgi:predicted phage tail protein